MRLCFGTFATVLNCCRQNVQQATLVARIAKVVDPCSRYIGENRYKIIEQEQDQNQKLDQNQELDQNQKLDQDPTKEKIEGDKPATNKLLHCKINFVFDNEEFANNLTLDETIKRFETEVAPFIDEDKKAKVILVLLDIIQKDKCIDFDKKENFKKFLGVDKQHLLQQSEFVFSDFLGRILLYSLLGNVDNTVGRSCVNSITNNYIDAFVEPYAYEYQWDTTSQTLVLSFVTIFNIFNQAILDYQIDTFVECVDPTNMMEFEWLNKCKNFLKHTESSIWVPFGPSTVEKKGLVLQKVQQFAQTLVAYTEYLPLNMRPLDVNSVDRFVPLYRDENVKWALSFEKNTQNYRQHLISIYQEICHHMIFYPESTT